MNNLPQEKTIIVNKPQRHAGVYAILNILEKQVYIGETIDFYHRIPEHIIGILENSDNENLLNAQTHNFEIFVLLDMVDTYAKNKKNEYSQEQLWLFHETLYMYLFRTYGFKLYNKVGHDNDKRSFLNNSYDNLDELYHGLQKYCQEKNIPEQRLDLIFYAEQYSSINFFAMVWNNLFAALFDVTLTNVPYMARLSLTANIFCRKI